MKRSNQKGKKKGERPVFTTCRNCGTELRSKFAAKNHICREEPSYG